MGLFAWRYGFVPKTTVKSGDDPADPKVPGATYGTTSITHYEYLQAKAKGIDRLAFLLDERVPWPPYLVDGFSTLDPAAPKDATAIRALRSELQLSAVVSYFSNPNDLEARVSAAVTVAGMSRQVRLNLAGVGQAVDTVNDSAPEQGIRQTIHNAGQQRALKIDLNTTWWSTRLYLTSALAERLTDVRRIVVVQGDEFVGQLSTQWIMSTLAAMHPTLAAMGRKLQQRRTVLPDAEAEMTAVFALWKAAFGGPDAAIQREEAAKVVLTADLLRRWFGDAMLQQPVRVLDLSRATVIELLRILDYPSEFVPVVVALGGADGDSRNRDRAAFRTDPGGGQVGAEFATRAELRHRVDGSRAHWLRIGGYGSHWLTWDYNQERRGQPLTENNGERKYYCPTNKTLEPTSCLGGSTPR